MYYVTFSDFLVTSEPVKKKARTGMEELLGDVYITKVEQGLNAAEHTRLEVNTYRFEEATPLNTDSQVWVFDKFTRLKRKLS